LARRSIRKEFLRVRENAGFSGVDPVWSDFYNRPSPMDGKASFFA
jgi:hypothetical protein